MIAQQYIEQGFPVNKVIRMAGLARSSYYYCPKAGKPGRKAMEYVFTRDGRAVSVDEIVKEIEALLNHEFVDYGYYKTYIYLSRKLGYRIGSSRVYQIMKKNNLLKFQRGDKKRQHRNWVKQLVPTPETEFSFLEFDIKYMYVAGKRTNVQVLTVLDVFSRWALGQHIQWSIRADNVVELLESLFDKYPLPAKFIVRNDNGSQFEADIVQKYLISKNVTQEFTKPATPQQNAHIEAYHSILESAVCRRMEFEDLNDVKQKMEKFIAFYNFERIHGGIGFQSPYEFLLTRGTDMRVLSSCKPCFGHQNKFI